MWYDISRNKFSINALKNNSGEIWFRFPRCYADSVRFELTRRELPYLSPVPLRAAESNRQPDHRTTELNRLTFHAAQNLVLLELGRGTGIWTPDLLLPKQTRFQLRYTPLKQIVG